MPRTPAEWLTIEAIEREPDDTVDELVALHLFDNLLRDVYEFGKPESEGVAELTPELQMFFYTWILEGDVANGGFDQYFYNHPVEYAERAIWGYRMLGADDIVQLIEETLQTHRANEQRMAETKAKTELGDVFASFRQTPFRALDERLCDAEACLRLQRVAVIRSRPERFIGERRA
jgi:hypothetical protein